jgi:hypothetical protein
VRLPDRDVDAAELRVVHPLQVDQVAAVVEDRDDDAPVVLGRLGLGRRGDLPGGREAEGLLVEELGHRGRPGGERHDEREAECGGTGHGVSLLSAWT